MDIFERFSSFFFSPPAITGAAKNTKPKIDLSERKEEKWCGASSLPSLLPLLVWLGRGSERRHSCRGRDEEKVRNVGVDERPPSSSFPPSFPPPPLFSGDARVESSAQLPFWTVEEESS